mmetsp:Transcript_59028/g.172813  ORF Transcript_59028/g.172813 Transcript_59028/m.172813 type:complete len:224 (+) Transcript_59028:1019-1690(+)
MLPAQGRALVHHGLQGHYALVRGLQLRVRCQPRADALRGDVGQQRILQDVVAVEQVVRVAPRVVQEVGGQGPLAPVRRLVLLVELDVAAVLDEIGQAVPSLQVQSPRCLPCVKHVHEVDREVPLEPFDVVVCAVQDFHDAGVAEDLVELVHLLKYVEGVQDVVFLPSGDLHQADEAAVRPEVVVLDVHRYLLPLARGLDLADHLPQVGHVADDDQRRVFHPGV